MHKICVEQNENSNEQGENCLGLKQVLGINRDIEKDLFVFDFDEIIQLPKNLEFTKKKKKKLLKINTAQFDLLGLISPMSMYRQE